jgi:hypothetical protein
MNTTQLPHKLNLAEKLDRHFLACSVLAGTAALAGTQSADAQIIYSGIQNAPIPSSNGFRGVYVDIDGMSFYVPPDGAGSGDGVAALPTYNWNPYRGNLATFQNALRSEWATSDQNTMGVVADGFLARLDFGTMIDENSTFAGNTVRQMAQNGPWNDADGYVGVTFSIGAQTVYGWMHLITGSGDPPTGGPGFPAVITSWAYESSGAGIMAGAVPEPSSVALTCLAAGALGLGAWRKRKKA